ncbi:hypothetical protein V8F20_008974 [Naviculisporaceae sp. PSN 640]
MVFHIARPVRTPAMLFPSRDEQARRIEQIYGKLRNKFGPLKTDQLFWLYGPERNEPLPYACRLNAPPPPFRDACDSSTSLPSAPEQLGRDSEHPISAIIRADMPHQFRQWFLQDDVIFFRTRSGDYLKQASARRKKKAADRQKFEKLWELLRAYMDMEACPACSSQMHFYKKCALLLVLCVTFGLSCSRTTAQLAGDTSVFLPIWLQSPRDFISTLSVPIINAVTRGNVTAIIVQVITACIRLLVLIAFTGLQLRCIWGLVFYWVPFLLSLGRGYLRYRDVLTNPVDPVCVCNYFSADRKYHTWEREIGETDRANHNGDHHHCKHKNKNNEPGMSTIKSESRRLGRSCPEQQGLLQSLRALGSFWAFYRRTNTGGDGWYRPVRQTRPDKQDGAHQGSHRDGSSSSSQRAIEPIIRRLELMERGDLVVCLTPYPDLVTVSWLAWVNRLYQTYRAWQRWLLAQRIYHLLELHPQQGPLRLGKIMFRSISNLAQHLQVRQRLASEYGDEVEGDLEGGVGGYFLVVEMPIDNTPQTGKWLL